MHDALFEHQRALDDRHLWNTPPRHRPRRDAGFRERLASHAHAARVREDFLSGVKSGVNGTPTFFINGIRHDDAWDADTLEQALRAV